MSRLISFIVLNFCIAGFLLAAHPDDRIVSRISPPAGFERISVPDGTFGAVLRDLKLKPKGTNARNQKGEEIDQRDLGIV